MKRTEQAVFRRFFASRMFLIVSLAIVSLLALGFSRAYYQDYKLRKQISNLQGQVETLKTKKLDSMEIWKYVSSASFVEETARTELNMKKPGENVLIINNMLEQSAINSSTIPQNFPLLKNTVKWWYYFTTHVNPNNQN